MGSSVEVFTNEAMTELETLGPLVNLAPGEHVEHIETWDLVSGIAQPDSQTGVDDMLPAIRSLFINQEEIK
jgi:hypothetical protein